MGFDADRELPQWEHKANERGERNLEYYLVRGSLARERIGGKNNKHMVVILQ